METVLLAKPEFSLKKTRTSHQQTLKQLFDLAASLILAIPAAMLCVVIACIVRRTSAGPIFFLQERRGYKGKTFIIFKFRTMIPNEERLTPVGQFLRSTHLDELPQLWNVIRGHMSMVGPRPLPLDVESKCAKEVLGFWKRYQVKPGLTGPVQILGRMEYLPDGVRQAFNLEMDYLREQSLWCDLRIIFSTVRAVLCRQGV